MFTEKNINVLTLRKHVLASGFSSAVIHQDVDLFFLIKHHFTVQEISVKAKMLFADSFNPILFSKQLCYFNDISFDEPVDFMPGFEVSEMEIEDFLTEATLTGF